MVLMGLTATVNYREDVDENFEYPKLYAGYRPTNCFQGWVSGTFMVRICLSSGTSNITSTEGIPWDSKHTGEFGIQQKPESFAFDIASFVLDTKGTVCELGFKWNLEISMAGMVNFFRSYKVCHRYKEDWFL
jgi:hypothetical protein